MATPLFVLTPTYDRVVKCDGHPRLEHLRRLGRILAEVSEPVLWVVVEDAAECSAEVGHLLEEELGASVASKYLCCGPTRQFGNAQRALGLGHLVEAGARGVVCFADDDNLYTVSHFELVRQARGVACFPVGCLGRHGVERPYVCAGRVVGWDAGWLERRFPLDTAGYAVHTDLLPRLRDADKAAWFSGSASFSAEAWYPDLSFGGETEFLEALIRSPREIECPGGCIEVGVWHDVPLGRSAAELAPATWQQLRFRLISGILGAYAPVRCGGLLGSLAAAALLALPDAGQPLLQQGLPSSSWRWRGALLLLYAGAALERERGFLRSADADLLVPSHAYAQGTGPLRWRLKLLQESFWPVLVACAAWGRLAPPGRGLCLGFLAGVGLSAPGLLWRMSPVL